MGTRQTVGVAAAMVLALASFSWGGGIEVPQQDARASAQAEAFTAQADDASAINYNPAGLTQLEGTSITNGDTVFIPKWTFHGSDGAKAENRLCSVMPHIYAESDFGLSDWRFGIGITNPFGLKEDWGRHGPLTAIVDDAHLYTITITPTVAYQINEDLSIGVGLNVYYGDLELTRNVSLGPPPTPPGRFRFRGYSTAVGASPGLMWRVDEHNTIGLVYHSPFTLDYSGNAEVKTSPTKTVAGPTNSFAGVKFPQQVAVGWAVRPISALKIEGDLVWSDWNVANHVLLDSSNPAFRMNTPYDWKSGFQYRLGTQYNLTEHWALRAGYAFGQSAVPSNTFTPLVPDSNYHLFAAGLGYSTDNWSIDAAYQFIFREPRHISDSIYGPLVDGTWKNQFHVIALTFTLKL